MLIQISIIHCQPRNIATSKGREKIFILEKSIHKHGVLTTEMLCVSCQHTWTHPYTAYTDTQFKH